MIKNIMLYYKTYSLYCFINLIVDKFTRKIRQIIMKFHFPASNKINIGRNSKIMGIKHIMIGDNFYSAGYLRLDAITELNGIYYTPKIIIKDNVVIEEYGHIGSTSYVEIGNNALIGSKVTIIDHDHGSYSGLNQDSPLIPPLERKVSGNGMVVIKDNVWIAEYVTVLANVIIGEGSIIGAGSVVTKDIPPYSLAVGVPAKVIKQYDFKEEKWKKAGGDL